MPEYLVNLCNIRIVAWDRLSYRIHVLPVVRYCVTLRLTAGSGSGSEPVADTASEKALFQSPPLGPDYALQTGHEIIEQIDAHPHHSLFSGATVPEHLRRDGALGLSSPSANGTRFLQHPPSASNGQ